MRHRGDLSRQIEALSSTDLATVELNTIPPGRTAHALTSIVCSRADRQLRDPARQRGCTVTARPEQMARKEIVNGKKIEV